MLDDHRRKAVAAVRNFSHRTSLSAASLSSYPVILTTPSSLLVVCALANLFMARRHLLRCHAVLFGWLGSLWLCMPNTSHQ